jgi:hypothetical protein
MSPRDSYQAWRGRWLLTGALLLITGLLGAAAARSLPRAYSEQASVVLLASRAAAKATGGNPYLSFSPSLTLAADVLSRQLTAPSTAAGLAARGYGQAYTVTLEPDSTQVSGSVLVIAVTGHDKAAVGKTVLAVLHEARLRLTALQSRLRPYDRVRLLTISLPPGPTMSMSQTLRPLIIAAGLGVALSFAFPWLVDAQVAQRRMRRRQASAGAAPGDATPAGAGPAEDTRAGRGSTEDGSTADGWAGDGHPAETEFLPVYAGVPGQEACPDGTYRDGAFPDEDFPDEAYREEAYREEAYADVPHQDPHGPGSPSQDVHSQDGGDMDGLWPVTGQGRPGGQHHRG